MGVQGSFGSPGNEHGHHTELANRKGKAGTGHHRPVARRDNELGKVGVELGQILDERVELGAVDRGAALATSGCHVGDPGAFPLGWDGAHPPPSAGGLEPGGEASDEEGHEEELSDLGFQPRVTSFLHAEVDESLAPRPEGSCQIQQGPHGQGDDTSPWCSPTLGG